MDSINDEQLQAMPKDKLKDLWEMTFRKYLTKLLATGPFDAVRVEGTLNTIGAVAIFFGKKYIASAPDLYSISKEDVLKFQRKMSRVSEDLWADLELLIYAS